MRAAKAAKTRVAVYIRVPDNDIGFAYYQSQCESYTKKIKQNPLWELAGFYCDKISPTAKERDGLTNLLRDSMNGTINLIITRSISSFGRSVSDTLRMVRSLADKGVGVYFEREGINTCDGNANLLVDIMGRLAENGSSS